MSECSGTSGTSFGGSSAGPGSQAGSETSDAKALTSLEDKGDESIEDLLEGNRGVQETIYASLYTLARARQSMSLRLVALRVVLEFLQIFRVVFNTAMAGWRIRTDLWVWRCIRWVMFRLLLKDDYHKYISVFYLFTGVVLLTIALTVWLALLLKRSDDTGGKVVRWLTSTVQFVAFVVFSLFWVSVFDYFVGMFACDWHLLHTGAAHRYWPEHSCLAMPHLAHMSVALVVAILFACTALCMAMSDCELNPMTRNPLASACAAPVTKIFLLKVLIVVLATALNDMPRIQAIGILICLALVVFYLVDAVPYFSDATNHIMVGLMAGTLYTSVLLVYATFSSHKTEPGHLEHVTWWVLYGILPAVLLGGCVSYARLRLLRRPLWLLAKASVDPAMQLRLREVYRFKSVEQVELLARIMRQWDMDGEPLPEAALLGEFVIKCGMSRFPNHPYLLTMYANFMVAVRADGQAGRTQLQLAQKATPGVVDRYFIFVAQELAKRLKMESGGLDLMGYVEFQRNLRACVQAHKVAQAAQKRFWGALLNDTIAFGDLQRAMDSMTRTERQATQVYRRVMERYPNNGRLLKIYGRFCEYLKHDPWAANKYYQDAVKQGLVENLLSLATAEQQQAMSPMGQIDEKQDGIVIINSVGVIMMINRAGCNLFGYAKGELEGKNVSILMPQPFCQRHNSFLQRYITTGESRVLNTNRSVVALNKDRSVFPVSLIVTRLSGSGQDQVFMGIVRGSGSDDPHTVKAWVSTTGVILCADKRFPDFFGIESGSMVGAGFSSLGTDMEALNRFVLNAAALPPEEVLEGRLAIRTQLLHKYLPPVDVDITVEYAGTDEQRILVMCIKSLVAGSSMMVTDGRGNIVYATSQLATLLGYPLRTLSRMDLSAVMQPPYGQFHRQWLKETGRRPPASSCRSGAVVSLLSANNTRVPVTLDINTHEDRAGLRHIIKVTKSTDETAQDKKRLVVDVDVDCVVTSVGGGASKQLFGIAPQELVGRPLCDFINVFRDWRSKFGEDHSLLLMLVQHSQEGAEATWRVGLTHPDHQATEAAAQLQSSSLSGAGTSDLRSALLNSLSGARRVRPAVMRAELLTRMDDADHDTLNATTAAASASGAVMRLELWRADVVSTVLELDTQHMTVTGRCEEAAGLIFGVKHTSLLKQDLRRRLGLAPHIIGTDLLHAADAKKGLIKSAGVARVGPVHELEGVHADGQPLKLQMQVVTGQGAKQRLMARILIVNPSPGNVDALVALKAGSLNAGNKSLKLGAAMDAGAPGPSDSEEAEAEAEGGDDYDEEEREDPEQLSHGSESGQPQNKNARSRIVQWVQEGMTARAEPALAGSVTGAIGPMDPAFGEEGEDKYGAGIMDSGGGGGATAFVSLRPSQQGHHLGPTFHGGGGGKGKSAASGVHEKDEGGSVAGDGASQGGSDITGSELDTAVAGNTPDGDDDLQANWRRAKRLRKLTKMMTSTLAQTATERFRQHTWALLLVMTLVHIACFAVLVTQVTERYDNARVVETLVRASDKGLMVVLRSNFIQKCMTPFFAALHLDMCTPEAVQKYADKLQENILVFREEHQKLYLRPFSDPALMDYWTLHPLPEVNYLDANISDRWHVDNRSLWDIGNRYVTAAEDVHYGWRALGVRLNDTRSWQYIYTNGQDSLFTGYSWSLDEFVFYAYKELGALSKMLVVLLVVEAVMVQLSCMAYQFMLLKACSGQQVRRFAVFLALPSATIRGMMSRTMKVDDDENSDVEDEDDMVEAPPAGGGDQGKQPEEPTVQATRASGQGKSVRMAAMGNGGRDDGPKPGGPKLVRMGSGAGGALAPRLKSAMAPAAAAAAKRKRRTLSQLFDAAVGTTVKINGKKLVPNSDVLLRFMVPLLLWIGVVFAIYGMSFDKLAGLQGPLSSLNVAAHVIYRIAHVRVYANLAAFSLIPKETAKFTALLEEELDLLRHEYFALLYGGPYMRYSDGETVTAPSSAFSNKQISHTFFRTTDCLRIDGTACYNATSEWYDVTHRGLDAIMLRFMDYVQEFSHLPPEDAIASAPSYVALNAIAPSDLYGGFQTATHLFVEYTIAKFQSVQQLHIILLVVTLLLVLAFVVLLFRPHGVRLHQESKLIAGMLSLLPAEVDVEGHIKVVVFQVKREDGRNSMMAGRASRGGVADGGGAVVTIRGAGAGLGAAGGDRDDEEPWQQGPGRGMQ